MKYANIALISTLFRGYICISLIHPTIPLKEEERNIRYNVDDSISTSESITFPS